MFSFLLNFASYFKAHLAYELNTNTFRIEKVINIKDLFPNFDIAIDVKLNNILF